MHFFYVVNKILRLWTFSFKLRFECRTARVEENSKHFMTELILPIKELGADLNPFKF